MASCNSTKELFVVVESADTRYGLRLVKDFPREILHHPDVYGVVQKSKPDYYCSNFVYC